MLTVKEIMQPTTVRVGMDETLAKVREKFAEHRFHHILVTDRNRLVGVISDRDLLKNISPFINKLSERAQDLATLNKRAHQVMTRKLITAGPDELVNDAACRMLEARVSCLPVVDEYERPLGIVSWRDILSALCACEAPRDAAA